MSYYKIHDLENYFKMYKKSVREPRKFWDRIADENFTWYQKWDKVFEFDMQEAKFKWFLDAKVNITKNSPPVFIVHGDADPTVPYQQSVDLYKKLLAAGVKTEFITVPGGLHGKFYKEKNNEINKAIMKFITELNW